MAANGVRGGAGERRKRAAIPPAPVKSPESNNESQQQLSDNENFDEV